MASITTTTPCCTSSSQYAVAAAHPVTSASSTASASATSTSTCSATTTHAKIHAVTPEMTKTLESSLKAITLSYTKLIDHCNELTKKHQCPDKENFVMNMLLLAACAYYTRDKETEKDQKEMAQSVGFVGNPRDILSLSAQVRKTANVFAQSVMQVINCGFFSGAEEAGAALNLFCTHFALNKNDCTSRTNYQSDIQEVVEIMSSQFVK